MNSPRPEALDTFVQGDLAPLRAELHATQVKLAEAEAKLTRMSNALEIAEAEHEAGVTATFLKDCAESALRKAEAENARLREALEITQAWIERWTDHVGNCFGGNHCTCGRSNAIYEAFSALSATGEAK